MVYTSLILKVDEKFNEEAFSRRNDQYASEMKTLINKLKNSTNAKPVAQALLAVENLKNACAPSIHGGRKEISWMQPYKVLYNAFVLYRDISAIDVKNVISKKDIYTDPLADKIFETITHSMKNNPAYDEAQFINTLVSMDQSALELGLNQTMFDFIEFYAIKSDLNKAKHDFAHRSSFPLITNIIDSHQFALWSQQSEIIELQKLHASINSESFKEYTSDDLKRLKQQLENQQPSYVQKCKSIIDRIDVELKKNQSSILFSDEEIKSINQVIEEKLLRSTAYVDRLESRVNHLIQQKTELINQQRNEESSALQSVITSIDSKKSIDKLSIDELRTLKRLVLVSSGESEPGVTNLVQIVSKSIDGENQFKHYDKKTISEFTELAHSLATRKLTEYQPNVSEPLNKPGNSKSVLNDAKQTVVNWADAALNSARKISSAVKSDKDLKNEYVQKEEDRNESSPSEINSQRPGPK